jgi:hypothetical protein
METYVDYLYLKLRLKETKDSSWDKPSDSTTINTENGDQVSISWRLEGCTGCFHEGVRQCS